MANNIICGLTSARLTQVGTKAQQHLALAGLHEALGGGWAVAADLHQATSALPEMLGSNMI